MGQVVKPDDLSSGVFLSCVMAGVVSLGVGMINDVAHPIPPSGASCDDVIDTSITALLREATLSEATCDALLFATQRAPSVLLGPMLAKLLV